MSGFVLKGHICFSAVADEITVLEDHYLVCEDGIVAGVFAELPEKYQSLPVTDYGDKIIIPGMSDLHIHASQFSFRGLGMDRELLEWLNNYTFPEESRFADLEYADKAYDIFVDHIRRSETTRLSVFATIHREATELLMQKLEDAGLVSYVGKLNMDRNSPDFYIEETADSVAETRRWIEETKDKWEHTKPIITPRFTPSVTDELMAELGKMSKEYGVAVQSHLSENLSEIAWVKELVPQAKNYGDAYDMFGMMGGEVPCIMAHCVYSDEDELALIKKNNVFIAHSPESNMNVSSGIAPISTYLRDGLNVGLATDVAGGSSESMFKALTHAIQSSHLRWRLVDQSVPYLTFDQAFYIATKGGGAFFGKVGSFEEGYEFDAVVLDDSYIDSTHVVSVRERLLRIPYMADERTVCGKYVAGRKLF